MRWPPTDNASGHFPAASAWPPPFAYHLDIHDAPSSMSPMSPRMQTGHSGAVAPHYAYHGHHVGWHEAPSSMSPMSAQMQAVHSGIPVISPTWPPHYAYHGHHFRFNHADLRVETGHCVNPVFSPTSPAHAGTPSEMFTPQQHNKIGTIVQQLQQPQSIYSSYVSILDILNFYGMPSTSDYRDDYQNPLLLIVIQKAHQANLSRGSYSPPLCTQANIERFVGEKLRYLLRSKEPSKLKASIETILTQAKTAIAGEITQHDSTTVSADTLLHEVLIMPHHTAADADQTHEKEIEALAASLCNGLGQTASSEFYVKERALYTTILDRWALTRQIEDTIFKPLLEDVIARSIANERCTQTALISSSFSRTLIQRAVSAATTSIQQQRQEQQQQQLQAAERHRQDQKSQLLHKLACLQVMRPLMNTVTTHASEEVKKQKQIRHDHDEISRIYKQRNKDSSRKQLEDSLTRIINYRCLRMESEQYKVKITNSIENQMRRQEKEELKKINSHIQKQCKSSIEALCQKKTTLEGSLNRCQYPSNQQRLRRQIEGITKKILSLHNTPAPHSITTISAFTEKHPANTKPKGQAARQTKTTTSPRRLTQIKTHTFDTAKAFRDLTGLLAIPLCITMMNEKQSSQYSIKTVALFYGVAMCLGLALLEKFKPAAYYKTGTRVKDTTPHHAEIAAPSSVTS